MTLQDVADELYALPPEDFTAARDAVAKATEDKDLKKEVKALRRPTVSAWLVNRLALERADLLDQLLALGPALAQAQTGRSGDDLRRLGAQRRELVAVVVRTAVQDAGREVPAATSAEVAQTLEAALADPATADAVRSGHLVRAVSYAGFGGVDLDGAVAVTAPPRRPVKPPDVDAEAAARDAAAALDDAVRALESAQRAQSSAQDAATDAGEQCDAAARSVADLEQRLDDARRVRDAAAGAAEQAAAAVQRAARQADAAAQAVREALDRAEKARAALDALRRG